MDYEILSGSPLSQKSAWLELCVKTSASVTGVSWKVLFDCYSEFLKIHIVLFVVTLRICSQCIWLVMHVPTTLRKTACSSDCKDMVGRTVVE